MSNRIGYWRRMVSSLRTSGLSRAEFCRRHQISYYAMTYWMDRLKEVDGKSGCGQSDGVERGSGSARRNGRVPDKSLSFVEVSLPATSGISKYEVVLANDRCIRFANDFDQDVLTRLIRMVESC